MAENLKENLKNEEDILRSKESQFNVSKKISDISKAILDTAKDTYKWTSDTRKLGKQIVDDKIDESKVLGKISKILKSQVVSFLKIGSAIAVGKSILDAYLETETAIGQEFGAIGLQTERISSTVRDLTAESVRLGYGVSDVLDASTALSSGFGVTLDSAFGITDKMLDTAKALGLSTDESVNLFGNLNLMGGLSFQVADNLLDSAVSMAMANKVAPQDVLKDIAGSTESFAKFSGEGGENILRAAIQAKKLGLNLDDVTGIAESLLDFQSSLEAELNAQVITGKQLNLQRARELVLRNDLSGMMEEVVAQLGSEHELTQMNAIERKALAGAVGVSVTQLSKLIGKEKESLTLAGALSRAKPFEEFVGENALNEFAIILNEMKSLGVILGNTVLPPVMDLIRGVRSFANGLKATIGPMNAVVGAMSILIGKSFGLAVGQIAIGLTKSFATGGIIGLVAGTIAAGGAYMAIQSLMAKGKAVENQYKAEDGANFMTNGPTNMLVGDNVGGKEHVKVTPAPIGVNYDLEIRNNTKKSNELLTNLNARLDKLNTIMYETFNPAGNMFRKQIRVTDAL